MTLAKAPQAEGGEPAVSCWKISAVLRPPNGRLPIVIS